MSFQLNFIDHVQCTWWLTAKLMVAIHGGPMVLQNWKVEDVAIKYNRLGTNGSFTLIFNKSKKFLVPNTFQAAASCPKKDTSEIERLFKRACNSRIPPCNAITTYFEASYPPPVFPPVLSRIITWINCASEKSTLVVTAHCRRNFLWSD